MSARAKTFAVVGDALQATRAAEPSLDDATPFPWSQIRRPARAKTIRRDSDAVPAEKMQAVAVALFGACKVPSCRALLEVDGSCPFASEHPKHECKACGAMHDEPIDFNHPCLFCSKAAE